MTVKTVAGRELIALRWFALCSGAAAQSISPLSENLKFNVNKSIAHLLLMFRFKSGVGIQIVLLLSGVMFCKPHFFPRSVRRRVAAAETHCLCLSLFGFHFVRHHKTAAAKYTFCKLKTSLFFVVMTCVSF